jgi:hypothetical protein
MIVAESLICYSLWIMGGIFFTSGNFVVFSPLCMKIYGKSIGGNMASLAISGISLGGILVYFVNLYILPLIGYEIMLYLVCSFGTSGFLLLYYLDLAPSWNDNPVIEKEMQEILV